LTVIETVLAVVKLSFRIL